MTPLKVYGIKVDEAVTKHDKLETKVTSMANEMESLRVENASLKREIVNIREDQLKLETHQRKNNGLFTGITESPDEKPHQCKDKLWKCLRNIPGRDNFYYRQMPSYRPNHTRKTKGHNCAFPKRK